MTHHVVVAVYSPHLVGRGEGEAEAEALGACRVRVVEDELLDQQEHDHRGVLRAESTANSTITPSTKSNRRYKHQIEAGLGLP